MARKRQRYTAADLWELGIEAKLERRYEEEAERIYSSLKSKGKK
jgi:hypothetical protein